MTQQEKEVMFLNKIQKEYRSCEKTKLEKLKILDQKVSRPAVLFSYGFGIFSALLLGVGMCLAMKVIGSTLSFAMPLGIGIGAIGILLLSINSFLYRAILKARKNKYKNEVLSLSDEILNK
ncbi:MAG TPA: dihydropteridine reductase [Candidatus Pelethenecus faecipullorum]|uniref:Dihydropteridine reductase n=1 Tax=Candidatus Pelethenecus faecipullorum TaxID=2840900 RepID=A0A9D1GQI1_9MOLU|nr:dihydropteridine reductase [Candidatus Pelethenecus faecipullorum]